MIGHLQRGKQPWESDKDYAQRLEAVLRSQGAHPSMFPAQGSPDTLAGMTLEDLEAVIANQRNAGTFNYCRSLRGLLDPELDGRYHRQENMNTQDPDNPSISVPIYVNVDANDSSPVFMYWQFRKDHWTICPKYHDGVDMLAHVQRGRALGDGGLGLVFKHLSNRWFEFYSEASEFIELPPGRVQYSEDDSDGVRSPPVRAPKTVLFSRTPVHAGGGPVHPVIVLDNENFQLFARCLMKTLLRDGLAFQWPGASEIAKDFQPDPRLQEMLSSRVSMPSSWSTHHDTWFIIAPLFRCCRESSAVCAEVAAYLTHHGGELEHGIWLLMNRRIFKHPRTWQYIMQYARQHDLTKINPSRLWSQAQPLMKFLAEQVRGNTVQLFGPGRPWLFADFGDDDSTSGGAHTWLDHAAGLSKAWAEAASRFAGIIRDPNIADDSRAGLIEQTFTCATRDMEGKVRGGLYVSKFSQGDCHDLSRSLARLERGPQSARPVPLSADVSVGPGPIMVFMFFLFTHQRVCSKSAKHPRCSQAEAKKLLKYLQTKLLREILDSTMVGNALLEILLARVGGSFASVQEILWDLHDLQVFLCMVHCMWCTFGKVVHHMRRLGASWADIVVQEWDVWPEHPSDLGKMRHVRRAAPDPWAHLDIDPFIFNGDPYVSVSSFCKAAGGSATRPGRLVHDALYAHDFCDDEVLLLLGVKSNLRNLPRAWRDNGILDVPVAADGDLKFVAVLRSEATVGQKANHTRCKFAELVRLPSLWKLYVSVANKKAKR